MKYYSIILTLFVLLAACNSNTASKEQKSEETTKSLDGVFGQEFLVEDAIDAYQFTSLFNEDNKVDVKLKGLIIECCQHSGCWMDIDIGNGETMQVLFKDGDFTIPIESAGKTAVINGIAYREQLEVNELKAMAKEDGQTAEEISLITEPKYEYSFVAEGVIIQ